MANYKDTLTLDDALRINGPMQFNIMIKPAGSLCNLDCKYCYYLDKTEIYGGREPRMSYEMLEKYIQEYIDANDVKDVCFNWHGGEPLIMGLDFYKQAVRLQQQYANGKHIHNTLQTNGILVNSDFAGFFKDEQFLIGVSIDGPKDIHDKFRKDKGAKPTFERVIRGIECLYKHGVEYNTMSTISSAGEGHGLEVYQFLKRLGTRYMQFMPVVEHIKYPKRANGLADKNARPYIVAPNAEGAVMAPWSVSSIGFGKYMRDIFDYWVRHDVGSYFVNLFDCTLASWCGEQPGSCAYSELCGGNSVIEHNGDLYPCDHFVYPEYRIGNINETSLRELMQSAAQTRFGIDKRNGLPRKCLNCPYYFACRGECPKHRFNKTESGETGLNALCEGYKLFYKHSAPYMERMRELLRNRQSPAAVMLWARQK